MIFEAKKKVWVDAIDDGKIVRVSEEYAKSEGLPIIRRQAIEVKENTSSKSQVQPISAREKKGLLKFEEFRRPLKGDKGIASELKENFNWDLQNLRKAKGLTRRQLAAAIGASEYDIKMFENGVLPREDYVLINKLEDYFRFSFRRDKNMSGFAIQQSIAKRVEAKKENLNDRKNVEDKKREDSNMDEKDFSGDDIDIIGDI